VTKRLVLAEHDQARREVVVFGGAEAPHIESASPGAAPAAAGSGGSGIDRKTIAFAVGGAGVAGLVVGSVFGAVASSKWSAAKSDCGAGCGPAAPAQGEKNTASSDAMIASVAFVLGAALAAGGVALYLTAPSGSAMGTGLRLAPVARSGEAGVVLAGGF
jgi:serine/threonine-protein kinase